MSGGPPRHSKPLHIRGRVNFSMSGRPSRYSKQMLIRGPVMSWGPSRYSKPLHVRGPVNFSMSRGPLRYRKPLQISGHESFSTLGGPSRYSKPLYIRGLNFSMADSIPYLVPTQFQQSRNRSAQERNSLHITCPLKVSQCKALPVQINFPILGALRGTSTKSMSGALQGYRNQLPFTRHRALLAHHAPFEGRIPYCKPTWHTLWNQ